MRSSRPIIVGAAAALMLSACGQADRGEDADDSSEPAASTVETELSSPDPLPFNEDETWGGTAAPEYGDGEPGEVSVVMTTRRPGDANLYTVVRNNTDEPIRDLSWAATAREDDRLLGSDRALRTAPGVIEPGELGFGYTALATAEHLPDDVEFSYDFWWSEDPSASQIDLRVTDVDRVGEEIIGTAVNDGDVRADTTGIVLVCFDGSEVTDISRADATSVGTVAPGDSVDFTAVLAAVECPTYAVTVSARAAE